MKVLAMLCLVLSCGSCFADDMLTGQIGVSLTIIHQPDSNTCSATVCEFNSTTLAKSMGKTTTMSGNNFVVKKSKNMISVSF